MPEKEKGNSKTEISEPGLLFLVIILPLIAATIFSLAWLIFIAAAIWIAIKEKKRRGMIGISIGVASFFGAVLLSFTHPSPEPIPNIFVGIGLLSCAIGIWLGPIIALKK